MDKKLKEDIATEYLPEYIQAEKKKRTGFWKALAGFNGKVEKLCRKANFEPWGITLTCALLCLGASIPLGIAAAGLWLADAAFAIYCETVAREKATRAIEKDIDNGTLVERYAAQQEQDKQRKIASLQEELSALQGKTSRPDFAAAASAEAAGPRAPAPENGGVAPKQPALNR
jgi:hypothetical protein